MQRFIRILGLLLVSLFVISFLHGCYVDLANYQRQKVFGSFPQPYLHNGDHQPLTVLHAGETFYLHTESSRTVPCSIDLVYRIITERLENGVYYRKIFVTLEHTRTTTDPGVYISDARLVVPAWLPPGDYLLDRNSIYQCDGTKIDQAPRMPFKVE